MTTDDNSEHRGWEAEIQAFLELEAERDEYARNQSKSGTRDGHLVMVYGSLKRGYGNHGIIQRGNGVFIGEAVTVDKNYEMLSMTAFPAVYRGGNGKHQIAGEVYAVDNSCLRSLDCLEGNGHFYTRAEVMAKIQNRYGLGTEGFVVSAWMYLVPAPMVDESTIAGWMNPYRDNTETPETESRILNWNR